MTSLPLAIVIHLAIAHAQTVAPETVAAFAQAESRLNPFAIFDNTAHRGYVPGWATVTIPSTSSHIGLVWVNSLFSTGLERL